jgi:hypothetical protein
VPSSPKDQDSGVLSGPLLRKSLPLAALFFFCSFNYTLLAATKDSLVVTAPGGTVEALPWLMSLGVLPSSVGFMFLYTRLVNVRAPPLPAEPPRRPPCHSPPADRRSQSVLIQRFSNFLDVDMSALL